MIKRYMISADNSYCGTIETEDAGGNWCLADEAEAALKAEREKSEKLVEALRKIEAALKPLEDEVE